MTEVAMKANDTLHISEVGPGNIQPGGEFVVAEVTAKELEARGLAKRTGAKALARAPENKMDAAPVNKAIKPMSGMAKSGK